MKKLVAILVSAAFLLGITAPMAAAGGRGYHYGHGFSHHGHYRYYRGSGDQFWFGLGLGVLTGALVSSFYYEPPPPPPSRVVYYNPAHVVVQSPPVVVQPPPVVVRPERFGTAARAKFGQVQVTAPELNIRSGPNLQGAVTGSLKKGDVLDVIESIPEWFYVRTPTGQYGWVVDRYTRPAQAPLG